MIWLDIFSTLTYLGIAGAILTIAVLSRRLGSVTGARPYYLGMYIAAVMVMIGAILRLLPADRAQPEPVQPHIGVVLLTDGLIALGVTVAVAIAWYYWSWLLAERD